MSAALVDVVVPIVELIQVVLRRSHDSAIFPPSSLLPSNEPSLIGTCGAGLRKTVENEQAMKERRRLPRTIINHVGKVLLDTDTIIECSVRNINGLGMCIYLKQVFDSFPAALDFSFDNFKTLRRCDVSWQHGHLVGIAFPDGGKPQPSKSTRAKVRVSPQNGQRTRVAPAARPRTQPQSVSGRKPHFDPK